VSDSIDALHPDSVVMVGIAFGTNSQKQAIGDVLVSRQLMSYEFQRVGTDKDSGRQKLIPRGDRAHASVRLVDRFTSGTQDWEGQQVHIGLILSGEKLVDNLDFLKQLLQFEPEALGGDMEGAACTPPPNAPRWIGFWSRRFAIGPTAAKTSTRSAPAARRAKCRPVRAARRRTGRTGAAIPKSLIPDGAGASSPLRPSAIIASAPMRPGSAPPPPALLIGRDDVLRDLKTRLTQARGHAQILTTIKGWPGVGKTTIAAALAHDADLARAFPDGVLWTSLGELPNVLSELAGGDARSALT